jgi:hypothetical protein
MSSQLIKYDAACRALAEARRVDEVKGIRDKAVAMQVYAKQAKDHTLIEDATEIRLRAERRAGELLREMEKNKGTRGQGRPKIGGSSTRPPNDTTSKLSDLNINKSQSSRWQKLADLSEEDFEQAVTRARERACTAADRTEQRKPKPKRKPKPRRRDAADISAACVTEVEAIVRSAISTLDGEAREALAQQLENAIRVIMAEAAERDRGNGRGDHIAEDAQLAPLQQSQPDRWRET